MCSVQFPSIYDVATIKLLFILSAFVLMKGSILFDWMEANFVCPKWNQIFLNLGMPQLKSDIMKQVSRALRAGCH